MRLLQIAVAICGLVPVSAGLAGILLGPNLAGAAGAGPDLDSHFRYLSGLLLGIGLSFWSLIPGIEHNGRIFRILTAIVVIGGLGRLYGILTGDMPGAPMFFGLGMELAVTPALCLWQAQLARRDKPRSR